MIFKSKVQNIKCSFVLLKPNVANIPLFNFCEHQFVQHGPIMIAIDCNGLSLLIFIEKWPNYPSGPISAPNSDSFWVHRLFNVCVRVFCAPNATILPRSKWTSSEKMIFFCQNRHLLYTQPYSFGGRIKLIICQIRYELSVTIYEISTSWRKNVRWRTLYNTHYNCNP